MTAKPRTRPTRNTAARPTGEVVAIPSTLWPTGPDPLDPGHRWPAPILTRAVEEFCPPGGRVSLLNRHAPATRGELRAVHADTTAAYTLIESLGHPTDPAPHTGTAPGAGPVGAGSVDLVVVSLLADHLDPVTTAEHTVSQAVSRLAVGGVLVVLGRCRHSRTGVLLDPAGPVVAAAQAADLLYLQHVIAAPVTEDTITRTASADPPDGPARHVVAHIDVFAFLLPHTTQD
ncbi:hypothetical protein [Nocardia bovistercoris]|uniref:Uncharacterized protein n=1 Tax=Nocardia bovistercoris TaxID=2785916 RepID=A0A931N3F4_9NOCA|nr:hypothetical protein [Nocardia bovistercoris]MBH0777682.1 hypothetical protein [Nocardia bovistercoris]